MVFIEGKPLLHGKLLIKIIGATNLWSKDRSLKERFSQMFVGGEVDPYVLVFAGPRRLAKTHTEVNNSNPKWGVQVDIDIACVDDYITFHVLTENQRGTVKAKNLGFYYLPIKDLIEKHRIAGTFPLTGESGEKDDKNRGEIEIDVTFTAVEELSKQVDTPNCYFPFRSGCKAWLYGDAHVPEGSLPEVTKADGTVYQNGMCWVDVYNSILNAQQFIYVTGWSVDTKITLLRDRKVDGESLTVGDLLKKKAAEGVCVRVLIWDEMLSKDGQETAVGLMSTHDEETTAFFQKYTLVQCRKVSRSVDPGDGGLFGGVVVAGIFTHHQKSIIVDQPSTIDTSKKSIIAYIGGLDITNGRYDTPSHPLFRTLQTEHAPPDFRNGNFANITEATGPRQPWHDIHALVEGPVALDVMQNFTERWKKQADDPTGRFLYNLETNKNIFIDPQEEAAEYAKAPDAWYAQLYRSIDARSAVLASDVEGALASKKGRDVDYSIAKAYVHQIRRAEKFIYIENQYFLGSSHMWPTDRRGDMAPNLVPYELGLKVASKIHAGEPFAAYILIPMFPEGTPTDAAIQEILYWQLRTVEMMYFTVCEALREVGSDKRPEDYLNFFCLGTRETEEGSQAIARGAPGSNAEKLLRVRRNPIYVHSKMLIVDDEVVILGSANINERSMAGTRDTEIAVGLAQANYLKDAQGNTPRGDIHGFRCSLWAEHLGFFNDTLREPHTKECVDLVVQTAKKNWETYISDDVVEMKSHLLLYPYQIMKNGRVFGQTLIPDTTASFGGAKSGTIPDTLTS